MSSPAVAAPIPQDKQRLLQLAEQCEREEPSYELDVAIECAAFDARPLGPEYNQTSRDTYRCVKGTLLYNPPNYTTFVDAAKTLEPKDAQEIVVRVYRAGVYVRITLKNNAVVYCEGLDNPLLTEPMARCAAALRARAAL